MKLAQILLAALAFGVLGDAAATEYFVSSSTGDDAASGTSPENAWKTLDRVSNANELIPGDVVRFRCGDVWRGTLAPRSGQEGKPILYASFGDGEKPILTRGVSLADERDWIREGDELWATRPATVRTLREIPDMLPKKWALHCESGAKARLTPLQDGFELVVDAPGSQGNHIQLFLAPFSIRSGQTYRLTFDLSGSGVEGASVSLMKSNAPWDGYGSVVGAITTPSSPTRRSLTLISAKTAEDARLTLYLGKAATQGATLRISNLKVEEIDVDALDLAPDVGNIVLDGRRAAWKRWTREDLKNQDDFWYDRDEGRVWYRSKQNPATLASTVEAAVMRHIVDHSHVSDVVFDGLALSVGGAHGFGGTGATRIAIRNCDVSWIGGGDQYREGGSGRRVRFGNGIEFWSSASDCLVENCRIWEVYDAALTNQGAGVNVERSIVYRNNLIWNCEYSFEYWNRDEESKTEKIRFENNVCLNAGKGWGHAQRPDPNGRCLMFYSNTAQTRDFVVSGNVFANATESLVRSDVEWSPEPITLDGNVYWQDDPTARVATWLKTNYACQEFDKFRRDSGQEANGKFERVDVEKLVPKDL